MTADLTGFRGARFIGASWRPGADARALTRLRGAISGWSIAEGEGWLLASEKAATLAQTDRCALVLGVAHAFDRQAATFPDTSAIVQALTRLGVAALDGMAPPFRAAWVDKATTTIRGETDVFGLGHMFVATAKKFAAVSSNATLLAEVLAAPNDPQALAAFALFGNFLTKETPFVGVSKLPAGASASLVGGRLSTAARTAPTEPAVSTNEALRAAVAAMSKAVPDAELELSGGLDSRLILASIPPKARSSHPAVTVGVGADPSDDLRVARILAEAEGLDWRILDVGGMATLDGPALASLLAQAAAGYDHMGNPLDKAALITAAEGRTVRARFSGQNGEILRGFYYVGQQLEAQPSEVLARRLIAWRLTSNDKTDGTLLAPEMRTELRAGAEARMAERLMSFGGTWGETLDRFYLGERMQSWVGNSAGNRFVEHLPLYPFFDPAFVAAAMATPAASKLNSRAAYRLLTEIDRGLAMRPLADGVIPANLPSSRLAGRLTDLHLDATRLVKRIRRRLAGADKPTLGSQTVAQQWHRLRLYEHLPMERLARTGLFDNAGLERISTGRWLPDRPTLGFLLLVAGLETRA